MFDYRLTLVRKQITAGHANEVAHLQECTVPGCTICCALTNRTKWQNKLGPWLSLELVDDKLQCRCIACDTDLTSVQFSNLLAHQQRSIHRDNFKKLMGDSSPLGAPSAAPILGCAIVCVFQLWALHVCCAKCVVSAFAKIIIAESSGPCQHTGFVSCPNYICVTSRLRCCRISIGLGLGLQGCCHERRGRWCWCQATKSE